MLYWYLNRKKVLFNYKTIAGQEDEKYFAISQSYLRLFIEIFFSETGNKDDGASWFRIMDSNQPSHGMKSKHFVKFHDLPLLN